MTRRIVLLGPPAAGKGTQAVEIEREFGLPSASTGAILREAMRAGTELGLAADELTRGGLLVPDATIFEVVKEWLDGREGGFVLDGFPRTPKQVQMLDEYLGTTDCQIDVAILLAARTEVIEARVLARRMCVDNGHIVAVGQEVRSDRAPCPHCGSDLQRRRDDTLEALTERMEEYRTKSQPLESIYRNSGLLVTIDANRSVNEVFSDVAKAIRHSTEAAAV